MRQERKRDPLHHIIDRLLWDYIHHHACCHCISVSSLHRPSRRTSKANRWGHSLGPRSSRLKDQLCSEARSYQPIGCSISIPDRHCRFSQSPAEFASLYRDRGLTGGHVIKLGPRNDEAAKEALAAWRGAFSIFNDSELLQPDYCGRRTSNWRRNKRR